MTTTHSPLLALMLTALGCQGGGSGDGDSGGSSTTGEPPVLEIIGLWDDDVSGQHDIDDKRWVQAFDPDVYTYFINYFDNDLRFVITRTPNDMTYAKFEWIYVGEQLYYCASVTGQVSAVAAETGPGADGSDPPAGGCVGAPWHPLTPQ